ncbi:MAG: tripartite tricarboxylate transporter substrate binding protein [Burkholderiales bacterium]|nr:tripartite tricarboxylate transporter substrate binding protein [Burkholderiales bacterium]
MALKLRAVFGAVLLWCLPSPGFAQAESPDAYPSKPVRLIIPFAPGGPTDILGRLAADILSKELGQQFVPFNVSGAGGTIGAIQVAKAKPDGYTLLLGTAGTIVNNPNIDPSLGYDALNDFAPITPLWTQPSVVMGRKGGRYSSLKELLAEARRRPGQLNYGSSGVGSFNHLSTELMSLLAGIKMTHVPYKGVAPALVDLMGDNLDVVLGPVTNLLSNSERLIGLAIAAPSRSTFAPAVPTSAEAGLPEFVYSSWGGLFAPAGVAPRIAERLSVTFRRSIADASIRKRFVSQGVEPDSGSPAHYREHVAEEFKRGRQLIDAIGLKK